MKNYRALVKNSACIWSVIITLYLIAVVPLIGSWFLPEPLKGVPIMIFALGLGALLLGLTWPAAHFHRYARMGKVRVVCIGTATERALKDYDSPEVVLEKAWHDHFRAKYRGVEDLYLYNDKAECLGLYIHGRWDRGWRCPYPEPISNPGMVFCCGIVACWILGAHHFWRA